MSKLTISKAAEIKNGLEKAVEYLNKAALVAKEVGQTLSVFLAFPALSHLIIQMKNLGLMNLYANLYCVNHKTVIKHLKSN